MATVTSPIITDDTGQDIKTAINALANAISPAASNVTFDNTGTGMVASNVQKAIIEAISLTDISNTIFANSDNINSVGVVDFKKSLNEAKLKMYFSPKALSNINNKALFTFTDAVPTNSFSTFAIVIKDISSATSPTYVVPVVIDIANSNGRIRFPNQGGYGDVGAVTTSTRIYIDTSWWL